MDDQQTYLLNGLLARQFSLGRIVRFRQVVRGRQATTYELLTAEQHEYVAYLYPPAYEAKDLEFAGRTVAKLDANRFSVVPFVEKTTGGLIAEGPQGRHLMVSLGTAGSVVSAGLYTEHDLSQVGLRLAWMHRLLKEQLGAKAEEAGRGLAEEVDAALQPGPRGVVLIPEVGERLMRGLKMPVAGGAGWAHGDITPQCLLHDGDHQLRTIVDWGLLHIGTPLEDLVDALLTLCGTNGEAAPPGMDVGRAAHVLEAYATLLPLEKVAWTPVVARWCGRRVVDAAAGRRELPPGFRKIVGAIEGLAVAIAGCV